ncbi:MAG: hypothetical protein HAW62_01545 [Endozoicomonadaceae bacterium]|nr:hypothetical protein [Endozoicomonadaceae bacterium]
MCNETQIEHDWLEITKSLEAVKTINFPLYGIPSKKPKLNRTHNEESQILQSTSKSTDYLQDIIEKLSVLSSQNRQELEKALSSYDLTMKTFVKNIHQMIFNLNRLNCLQSNIGLSTSTNTHMTENQTLINVFDEMSLVAL